MIVWVNGAFGVGKTSAARELTGLIPGSTLFDPGLVAAQLPSLLPRERLAGVKDFQDLGIWRRLVVDTAAAVLAEVGGVLVIPMTLLTQAYRDEIFGGLAARRIPVRHVLLATAETILRRRIAAREARGYDFGGRLREQRWAYEHIEPYRAALATWLPSDAYILDAGSLTPRRSAELIARVLHAGTEGNCDIVQTPEPTAETVASGVLLFDEADRVLLVDPTYKAGWEFPGGVVEPGEAPARAGAREVAEETGIRLEGTPRLLVVDWEAPAPPGYGGMRLLFDGGRLEDRATRGVLLPGSELRACRFVTEREAASLLPPVRYERLRWALRAREQGSALYLEGGIPVG